MEFYIGVGILVLFGLYGILLIVKEYIRESAIVKIHKELARQRTRELKREWEEIETDLNNN